MKKRLVANLLLILGLTTCSNAQTVIKDQAKLDELKSMSKVLQDPIITIKGAIDKKSVYILKVEVKSPSGLQNITAFLDKKTKPYFNLMEMSR